MKLYSVTCVGFLIVFTCNIPTAPVKSDFCDILRPEIQKLRSLTKEELAALKRPRKEAIRNLRKTFKDLKCPE